MTRSLLYAFFCLFVYGFWVFFCTWLHVCAKKPRERKKTIACALLQVCIQIHVCTWRHDSLQVLIVAWEQKCSQWALRDPNEHHSAAWAVVVAVSWQDSFVQEYISLVETPPTPHLHLFTADLGLILTQGIAHYKELFFFRSKSLPTITQCNLLPGFWIPHLFRQLLKGICSFIVSHQDFKLLGIALPDYIYPQSTISISNIIRITALLIYMQPVLCTLSVLFIYGCAYRNFMVWIIYGWFRLSILLPQ